MKKKKLFLVIVFFVVVLLPLSVQAAVPAKVNYQGKLFDSLGNPITGTVNIVFEIFDAQTGGASLWTESQTGISVAGGLFNTQLGSVTPLLESYFTGSSAWLEISVNSDPAMTPRQEITSVIYALRAGTADIAITALDADKVDGVHASDLEESIEIVNAVNTHQSNPSAHHNKTTNFNELTAGQATNGQIANNAVTSPKILNGTVAPVDVGFNYAGSSSKGGAATSANSAPWSGLTGVPAGFVDGVDNTGITTETDPQVGSNTLSFIPRWNGSALVTGSIYDNGAGRIGIGTTPAFTFDVRGGVGSYLGYFSNIHTGLGSAYGLYARGDAYGTGTRTGMGGYFYGRAGSTSGNSYGIQAFSFAYGSSTSYAIYADADGGSTRGKEWAFYGMGDSYFSGNVGIGTSTPGKRLSLGGTGSSNGISIGDNQTAPAVLYHTSSALRMRAPNSRFQFGSVEYIEDCGAGCTHINSNVGIGTTSPMAKLDINQRGNGAKVLRLGIERQWCFMQKGAGATTALELNSDCGGANNNKHFVINTTGNVGIGTTIPGAKLDVSGTTRTNTLIVDGGADLSEFFDVNHSEAITPGMVVAIDIARTGELRIADTAYDRTVAGIVSGANGINSGFIMSQTGTEADGSYPIALTGRVYALADATYGNIQAGDLLTTSNTPGHLMKVTDYKRANGSIIGKAMSSLEKEKGFVLVLVGLQ